MRSFRQDHGNRLFRKKDFDAALKWYFKAVHLAELCIPNDSRERSEIDSERYICLNNVAACQIGLEQYQKCVETCTEALEASEGSDIKALFRRAKAFRHLCKFQEAFDDLKVAIKIDVVPTLGRSLRIELEVLKASNKIYQSRTKAMAKRMMSSF